MEPDAVDPMETTRQYWDESSMGEPTYFLPLGGLMRLHRFVTDRVEERLKAHQITRNGYLLLMRLIVSPHGSRILSKLADDLMVHPTTITLTIDRLEGDGLVAKVPHENDRRAIRATITAAGRSVAKSVTSDLAAIDFGFEGLSKAGARRFNDLLTDVRRSVGDVAPPPRASAPSEAARPVRR